MEKQLIFIDECVKSPSKESINILMNWMEENEKMLKGKRASTNVVTHQNEEGSNWRFE